MQFLQFLFIIAVTNIHICKSVEKNNVYRNLYGDRHYNHSFLETATKLITGISQFVNDGDDLLAKELKDTTPKFDEEYDFIVVGAGSAGCTVAARLSEIGNVTVLLIEGGGEENLLYDVPIAASFLQFSHLINRRYQPEPSKKYCLGLKGRRCNWPAGRVMGGTSVLNLMIATRGHPSDYDGWADLGNIGWSYNDTLKYFKKLEEIGIPELRADKKFHNTEGPLYISYSPFHTPLADAFLESGVEQGYPIIDYNGEKRIGYSYTQCTIKNGERVSTNRAYLYPNRKRKNLIVSKNSNVNKVLIDPKSKKAYGVEFTKSERNIRVKARKEIILCAGAVDSPKLLMLSGVGPSDHLKDMKIEVIQDAPVGKNLMDHICYLGLLFRIDQPVSTTMRDTLNPNSYYIIDYLKKRDGPLTTASEFEAIAFVDTDDPNNLDAYPNIAFLFAGGSFASFPLLRKAYAISDEYWENTFANITESHSWSIYPMLLHPRSRGELLLRNKNPKSQPKLVANYFDDPEDLRTMIKGIRAAIQIGKTKAMQRFKSQLQEPIIPGCERYKYDSDEYWGCAARALCISIFHQSGTCRMAPEDDASGVVNPRLQVKGVKGLRVADASIMPTVITGRTHIPTVMIAEKATDMIKEDWGFTGSS